MSKVENSSSGHSRKTVHGLTCDERGTVAIEFAILAPLMLLLVVGIADVGTLLMKYRHGVQAAASLAQVGSRLSVQNRSTSQGAANSITDEQSALLNNGLKMVFGEKDAAKANAIARRVIRSGNTLKSDWAWSQGNTGKGGNAFPLNAQEILSQIAPGESLMVVDVSFTHQFFFSRFFGRESHFTAHYTAGVPSY